MSEPRGTISDAVWEALAAGGVVERPPSAEMLALARRAVEAKKTDTRTDCEIIRAAVAFVMDERLGGP